MRRIAVALVVVAMLGTRSAEAQQRGSDVGGQPARRKITKMPKLVVFVDAEYPPEKKAQGVGAQVLLTLDIDAVGRVTSVTVAESAAPDFDAAAIAAAKRLVFEPAEVDDRPAPSKITFRYTFVVRDETPPTPTPPPPPPPEPEPKPEPVQTAPTGVEDVEIQGQAKTRREAVQTTIRADQARKVAGTQGDVLKVVQNLPGVSRPPVASGQIVVWGSAPRETKFFVDGVEIPALYHGSGLRSVVSSDLVASIDLVPGAYGAEYGRGLGGLVRIETRPLPSGTHAVLAADTLDGAALMTTSLSEKARIAISARQSWLDRVLAGTSAPDVGDFFPIPRYRDGQIKATIDLRKRESMDVVVLGSSDELARTVPSVDPAATRAETTTSRFARAWVRYTNVDDAGDTTVLTPFVGIDETSLEQRFGGVPARLAITSKKYGLRGAYRMRVGTHLDFTGGVDALGSDAGVTREGSLTLPPREGDRAVFGQPPGDDVAFDDFRASIVDIAPHLHADVKVGPLTITPGARFDTFLIEGSRRTPRVGRTPEIGFSRAESALQPRLSTKWQIVPRLAMTAAYGTYTQAPEPEELSAVFGTPDLALSRATHVAVGEALRITPTLTAEVVGFRKTLRDLTVRSRATNPLLARSLVQNGEGRSYGVQLLLRQEMWSGFFGWVSYAITKSERRYEDDDRWRPFDFDQPHVLSVVASQDVARWTFGARFRYATGNPRTPVLGSSYDARADRFDPIFGPQSGIRIPAFWQLDLRVERAFPLSESARVLVFADVQNVTNRENAEEIVYSSDFRRRGTIRGLPTIAILGARLEL